MLTIVNDILDFSKIEAGKLEFHNNAFYLADYLQMVTRVLDIRAEQKGITFVHAFANNVPERVVADAGRLGQIVINLIGNAIKFAGPRGGILLYAELLTSDNDETHLHIAVTDSGQGIPEEKLDVIFDSFTQADTTLSRSHGGTGLGLAICRNLVQLMGGKIWVRSRMGVGSAFHFTIRCEVIEKEVGDVIESDFAATSSTPQPKRVRPPEECIILLAEDNLVNQKVASHMLERAGYQVKVASNGKDVLRMVREDAFDLILMDCQMPEIDGFEATMAIRAQEEKSGARVPIIALTAHAIKGYREQCLEAGMDAYISKPFNKQNLLDTIAEHLRGSAGS